MQFKYFLLMAVLCLMPKKAQAQATQEYVTISSATHCAVNLTTGTATRIDNYNGQCEGLMKSRTEVSFCVPTGGTTIHWGYSSTVSSQTSSGRYGEELKATGCKNPSVNSAVQVWAFPEAGAGSAGQTITIQQAKPVRGAGE